MGGGGGRVALSTRCQPEVIAWPKNKQCFCRRNTIDCFAWETCFEPGETGNICFRGTWEVTVSLDEVRSYIPSTCHLLSPSAHSPPVSHLISPLFHNPAAIPNSPATSFLNLYPLWFTHTLQSQRLAPSPNLQTLTLHRSTPTTHQLPLTPNLSPPPPAPHLKNRPAALIWHTDRCNFDSCPWLYHIFSHLIRLGAVGVWSNRRVVNWALGDKWESACACQKVPKKIPLK